LALTGAAGCAAAALCAGLAPTHGLPFPATGAKGTGRGIVDDKAIALMKRTWLNVDPERYLDTHCHVIGLGHGNSGCYVNPRNRSPVDSPIAWLRFEIYRLAAGVESIDNADQQYVDRLLTLIRDPLMNGAKLLLLPFDYAYSPDGKALPEESEFFTPNGYVAELCRQHPDAFVPAASVHPYRKDAIEALERAVDEGAIAVKWLPAAQQIDPSDPKCDAFYEAMVRLQIPLISHAGEELAVEATDHQRLGNPLHLRRPLNAGVDVIVAHCASLGENTDLRNPDSKTKTSFSLFLEMLEDNLTPTVQTESRAKAKGRLWGDISATTQANRCADTLETLLHRTDLQSRLVNGSDYPLPAIHVLIILDQLVSLDLLDSSLLEPLRTLFEANPLAFELALKRALRDPEDPNQPFPDQVFMPPNDLFPRRRLD